MPRVYRAMKADAAGKPVVEASAQGLGVRVSIGELYAPGQSAASKSDIDLDDHGKVLVNGKGM